MITDYGDPNQAGPPKSGTVTRQKRYIVTDIYTGKRKAKQGREAMIYIIIALQFGAFPQWRFS